MDTNAKYARTLELLHIDDSFLLFLEDEGCCYRSLEEAVGIELPHTQEQVKKAYSFNSDGSGFWPDEHCGTGLLHDLLEADYGYDSLLNIYKMLDESDLICACSLYTSIFLPSFGDREKCLTKHVYELRHFLVFAGNHYNDRAFDNFAIQVYGENSRNDILAETTMLTLLLLNHHGFAVYQHFCSLYEDICGNHGLTMIERSRWAYQAKNIKTMLKIVN